MEIVKIFGIVDALQTLAPGSQWTLTGDEYSGLDWISKDIKKPTEAALKKEAKRLQDEYDAQDYARKRAAEYPDFREYLDGWVKGDDAQLIAYTDACLAVKAKYPKPGA